MTSRLPALDIERELMTPQVAFVAGLDEVGRGALAGPVTVGAVVVDRAVVDRAVVDVAGAGSAAAGTVPVGLRDSKLLTPSMRDALIDPITAWACDTAIGHASPEEIDADGIVAALGLAGRRALAALDVVPDVVLLDGRHDFLSTFPASKQAPSPDPRPDDAIGENGVIPDRLPAVHLRVKADRDCASVAAASVVAKVARDRHMGELAVSFPAYGWDRNKGYGTAEHAAAIRQYGHSVHHRRTWRVPQPPE